jgi:hypothetical protein
MWSDEVSHEEHWYRSEMYGEQGAGKHLLLSHSRSLFALRSFRNSTVLGWTVMSEYGVLPGVLGFGLLMMI